MSVSLRAAIKGGAYDLMRLTWPDASYKLRGGATDRSISWCQVVALRAWKVALVSRLVMWAWAAQGLSLTSLVRLFIHMANLLSAGLKSGGQKFILVAWWNLSAANKTHLNTLQLVQITSFISILRSHLIKRYLNSRIYIAVNLCEAWALLC